MDLPVLPPVKPMLAKAVAGIPQRDDLIFEPKWDGFRAIIFRDRDDLVIGSRNEKPLTRYFPEMVEPLKRHLPLQCVVDGELILATDGRLDFDRLQQRIHPAESRVKMLAATTPASFVAFDLLALGQRDLRHDPFGTRRQLLADALGACQPPVYLTPTTQLHDLATEWFEVFEGAGLDGLIAKPVDLPYAENKRTQLKVKHVRTADVVVAGFRWHKDGQGVGSLLLGLYTPEGELHHVGVAASFTAKYRSELVEELLPLAEGASAHHPWRHWADATAHSVDGRMPGAPNRWSANKDHSWVPLHIERVAEVKYGSTLNGRFRDVTKMLRWRVDKSPSEATFDQLTEPKPVRLDVVLGSQ